MAVDSKVLVGSTNLVPAQQCRFQRGTPEGRIVHNKEIGRSETEIEAELGEDRLRKAPFSLCFRLDDRLHPPKERRRLDVEGVEGLLLDSGAFDAMRGN